MIKIQEKLQKHLVEKWNTRPAWMNKAKPNMKASIIGSECLRKIFYTYLRTPQDYGMEYKNIEVFEKGEAFHKVVQKWLNEAGLRIPYVDKKGKIPTDFRTGEPNDEFPVNEPDLNLRKGGIDGVGIVDGSLWIYELKSINQKGYDKYLKKGPKKDHIQQGMLYLHVFNQQLENGEFDHIKELKPFKETGAEGVIFIYINREADAAGWKEFWVRKDEGEFLKVVEKVMKVKKHVDEKTLPEPTEEFCPWCPFRDKCSKNYNPLVGESQS